MMGTAGVAACRHFVTHADHRYLPKALALHASLQRHHPSFLLWIICTSAEAFEHLQSLPVNTLRSIPLGTLEDAYPQLREAKANRTLIEYYYTIGPAACRFVLEHPDCADMVTYVDADIFFFGSPEAVFTLLGQSSVGITPHRFSFWVRHARRVGDYNVGWITFRKDSNGNACLQWWFDRCIEWCYQRHEDGKYADQGYLNSFPQLFRGVKVIDDPGVNLAPWNLANHFVRGTPDAVTVDGKPLVFFHFADFVQVSKYHYSTNTSSALIWLTPRLRRLIFRPYIETLRKVSPGSLPKGLRGFSRRQLLSLRALREAARMVRKVLFMQYMFVIGRRII